MMEIPAGHRRSILQQSCVTTTVRTTHKIQYLHTIFIQHRIHYLPQQMMNRCLNVAMMLSENVCYKATPFVLYVHIHKEFSINQLLPFTQNKNKKDLEHHSN